MRINHRFTSSVCAVLVACLVLSALSFAALAILPPSLDQMGSITLRVVSGSRAQLYAVATITAPEGPMQYTYTSAFAGCGLNIDDLTRPDYASTLAVWASTNAKPTATGDANILGRIEFKDLVPGAYLVVQTHAPAYYSRALPFIVTIPMQDGAGGWNYDIDANIKFETNYNPPPPPPPGPITTPAVTTTVAPDTTTAPVVTTVPDETTRRPEDTTTPGPIETTTVPPETTTPGLTTAPETTTAPSETTIAPPETTIAPPETTTTPDVTTEPGLPQTGQDDRPIMMLAVIGMMLFAAGWLLRFGRKDEHEE